MIKRFGYNCTDGSLVIIKSLKVGKIKILNQKSFYVAKNKDEVDFYKVYCTPRWLAGK